MIERLPCKPKPTSWRPCAEYVALCLVLAIVLYIAGA